jgi:DNA-binding winged helix-turn-helix (wHTH) protein
MEEVHIGEYTFNKVTHQVTKLDFESFHEPTTRLDYKQSRILELLISNQGKVVSRETFAKEIWDSSFVSDATINNKICALRKAFSDNSRTPRYIKTHPQAGYELLAKVKESKTEKTIFQQSEKIFRELYVYFNSQVKISIGHVLMLCAILLIVVLASTK